MKKFEYIEKRYSWDQANSLELNKLGKEGWELVGVVQEMDCNRSSLGDISNLRSVCIRYTFKRELI